MLLHPNSFIFVVCSIGFLYLMGFYIFFCDTASLGTHTLQNKFRHVCKCVSVTRVNSQLRDTFMHEMHALYILTCKCTLLLPYHNNPIAISPGCYLLIH